MEEKRPARFTLIAFVVSTILGGNNAIAVRFSNVELPPFFRAAIRFAAASVLLFLIVLALRLPLPKGRSLAGALLFGGLQFGVSYALIYWSLLQVQAGLFQVVFAVVPILTFVFAMAHRQETFHWRILVGGLLAVGGVTVVFRDQLNANAHWLSLLAIVLAAACVAEWSSSSKPSPKPIPSRPTPWRWLREQRFSSRCLAPVSRADIERLGVVQGKSADQYLALVGKPFDKVPAITECGEGPLRVNLPSQAATLPFATTAAGVVLAGEVLKSTAKVGRQLSNYFVHDLRYRLRTDALKFKKRNPSCPGCSAGGD